MKIQEILEYIANSRSYWINTINSKLIEFDGYHTSYVIKHPEMFDLTSEDVIKYNSDSDVSAPILNKLLQKGWVTIRTCPGNDEKIAVNGLDKNTIRKALYLYAKEHEIAKADIDVYNNDQYGTLGELQDSEEVRKFIKHGIISNH